MFCLRTSAVSRHKGGKEGGGRGAGGGGFINKQETRDFDIPRLDCCNARLVRAHVLFEF